MSYQCPAMPDVLHVLESDFIAEVIDPQSGQVVAPGQTGELVLTNLGRLGSPVLRYRTSDLVKRPESYAVCVRKPRNGIAGRHPRTNRRHGDGAWRQPLSGRRSRRLCARVKAWENIAWSSRSAGNWPRLPWKWKPSADCQDPSTLGERLQKDAGNGVYSAHPGFGCSRRKPASF